MGIWPSGGMSYATSPIPSLPGWSSRGPGEAVPPAGQTASGMHDVRYKVIVKREETRAIPQPDAVPHETVPRDVAFPTRPEVQVHSVAIGRNQGVAHRHIVDSLKADAIVPVAPNDIALDQDVRRIPRGNPHDLVGNRVSFDPDSACVGLIAERDAAPRPVSRVGVVG